MLSEEKRDHLKIISENFTKLEDKEAFKILPSNKDSDKQSEIVNWFQINNEDIYLPLLKKFEALKKFSVFMSHLVVILCLISFYHNCSKNLKVQ